MDDSLNDDSGIVPATADEAYTVRLATLSQTRLKRMFNVQAPYQAHIRSLQLKRTLDVGCGIGRNMGSLDSSSVGVDHNRFSIDVARKAGYNAYTPEEFFGDAALSKPASFDSILSAHVVEHLTKEESREIFASYLPLLKPGGRVVLITPQEVGYKSDATHITFSDFDALAELASDLGLEPVKHYSFPFPRFVGKVFPYNEFVSISRLGA